MEEPTFIDHLEMDSPNDCNFQSFSSMSYSSSFQAFDHKATAAEVRAYTGMEIKPAVEQLTTNKHHVITPKASSYSSSQIISFGNSNSPPVDGSSPQLYGHIMDCCTMKPKADEAVSRGNINSGQGTELQRQDHVLAERMRREKLSQLLIALTALIPDLKKVDKASVLGEATKYLKQLQERVKMLEEQTAKKVVESVVFVKRSRLSSESDHHICSSDENFECKTDQPLPEIEARVSDRNVLIRIHCEKHKGYIAKILSEIEKLHLSVTNSCVLPFGNHAMNITVVAQMDTGYCMTAKDLVKNLKQSLLKTM